jgi:hypothetical protein
LTATEDGAELIAFDENSLLVEIGAFEGDTMNWFQTLLFCLLLHVNAFTAPEVLYSCEQLEDSTNNVYSVELLEKDFHEFVLKLKDKTKNIVSEIEMFQDSKYDAICKKFLDHKGDQLHFNCAQFRENGKPWKMITAQFDKIALIRIQIRHNNSTTSLSLSGSSSSCKVPSKKAALVYFLPIQKPIRYEDAEVRCGAQTAGRLVDGFEALLAPVVKDGYKFWTTDNGGWSYHQLVVDKPASDLPYRYYLRTHHKDFLSGTEYYNTAHVLCVTP